jgi:DNA (cytosine-5)-methyltransferase 1
MARTGLGEDWQCLFANDIDPSKATSYVANFGPHGLKVGDVASLGPADLPGHADLAWGSPPCQDVSLAGDRAGLDGARSGAFWPFWNLIRALRAEGRAPRLIVIENVTGLITSHDGKDFAAICDALTEAGYRFGAVVVDASLFVPQSRERVFIIAVDADIPIPTELIANRPAVPFHPPALVKACNRQGSAPIWWRLPVPPARNTALVDIVDDEPQGAPWNSPTETDRIVGMMDPGNLAKVEAAKRAGKPTVGTLFRRTRDVSRWEVRFDGLAGCLRVPSGGSSRQTVMIINGASVRTRLLSPRECARLMGLPDSYKLPANVNEALGLMGDGVVAPVVRHLTENLLEPLLGPTRVVPEPSDSERLRIQAQARI